MSVDSRKPRGSSPYAARMRADAPPSVAAMAFTLGSNSAPRNAFGSETCVSTGASCCRSAKRRHVTPRRGARRRACRSARRRSSGSSSPHRGRTRVPTAIRRARTRRPNRSRCSVDDTRSSATDRSSLPRADAELDVRLEIGAAEAEQRAPVVLLFQLALGEHA